MKRGNFYNLCLYSAQKNSDHLHRLALNLKFVLTTSFDINPTGYGYAESKIKNYSDASFMRLKNKTDLDNLTIFFGGEAGVNDDWDVYLEIDNSLLSLIIKDNLGENILGVIKKIIQIISGEKNITSGFIDLCSHKKLPQYYNHGISSSDMSRDEKDKIRSWGMHFDCKDGQYKPGDLRDVYPYNIISELHLNRNVHGQTLESWIKSDPSHGTLEKISDTHWLWTVEDQHIPHTQEVLSSAHLLVAYWEKY